MDPLTIMAIASMAQLGFGMYSQQQQVRAQNKAMKRGVRREIENRNRVLEEGEQRRKRANAASGGNALEQAQGASQQGTILTQTNDKRSLLG